MARNYNQQGAKESAAVILYECVKYGNSTGWCGSKEDLEEVENICNKFNVKYVSDYDGEWALANMLDQYDEYCPMLTTSIDDDEYEARIYNIALMVQKLFQKNPEVFTKLNEFDSRERDPEEDYDDTYYDDDDEYDCYDEYDDYDV